MTEFILGLFIGTIIGMFIFGYLIVSINKTNPETFDQIIKDLRNELETQDN